MIYRFYRKRRIKGNLPCPDEETLVCFSEGKLSNSESKKIQEHIISCSRCSEVIFLYRQQPRQEREVPEFLIENVKNLIEQKTPPNILEVVLALKEKALQILRSTGDVIMDNEIIPLPVLRSRRITDFPEEIRLIKEFQGIKITIHIQKKDRDKIRVNLNLTKKIDLLPLEGLRLTLLKGTEEIESYDVIAGNVAFDNLGLGRYAIEILREGNKLGAIYVEIK